MGNVLLEIVGCEFNDNEIDELCFTRDHVNGCRNKVHKICDSWYEAYEIASKVILMKGKHLGHVKHYKGEATLFNYVYDMDELDVYYS